MDTASVAYVLCRIEDDASLTPSVSMRTCLVASRPVSIWSRCRTLTSAKASTQPIWWLVWLGSPKAGWVIVSGIVGVGTSTA